ncbi:hypothetical protein PoB_002781500 [Plakobranchus ocellatus]|uniref:Uncharacterized protein n=1 Tax=Plakobranchus ocellatus TaxID=259542 RepID=A0AAV4A1L6_9GAST|nr:hypothetical protein PoB_002781500 [Plakobranchus ocellatus]
MQTRGKGTWSFDCKLRAAIESFKEVIKRHRELSPLSGVVIFTDCCALGADTRCFCHCQTGRVTLGLSPLCVTRVRRETNRFGSSRRVVCEASERSPFAVVARPSLGTAGLTLFACNNRSTFE